MSPFNIPMMNAVKQLQGMLIAGGASSNAAYVYVSGLIQQQVFADSIRFTLTISTLIAIVTIPLTLLLKHTDKSAQTNPEVAHAHAD